MTPNRRQMLCFVAAAAATAGGRAAQAAEAEVIDARVDLVLARMEREVAGSADLAARAVGLLVMPRVVKGGFLLGGTYGEGALRLNDGSGRYDTTAEYYSVAAASLGLQAGIQETAQILFFLSDRALEGFRRSDGWEVGADAEVTVLDASVNLDANTTEAGAPVVAILLSGSGLLLGASLEGAKYSRIVR